MRTFNIEIELRQFPYPPHVFNGIEASGESQAVLIAKQQCWEKTSGDVRDMRVVSIIDTTEPRPAESIAAFELSRIEGTLIAMRYDRPAADVAIAELVTLVEMLTRIAHKQANTIDMLTASVIRLEGNHRTRQGEHEHDA